MFCADIRYDYIMKRKNDLRTRRAGYVEESQSHSTSRLQDRQGREAAVRRILESIGNTVYGGIYSPKHPTADDLGFRRDIIDAVKEFDLPAVRLPGGNWVSGWDWKGSIGPRENRRAALDLAWFKIEPNIIGHDEYIEWTKRANTEPMYTINLGTGDINSAAHLVEYSRYEGGTYWSDLRKKYGHPDPYPIRTWYLGNEMDGHWQIGSWEKTLSALGSGHTRYPR